MRKCGSVEKSWFASFHRIPSPLHPRHTIYFHSSPAGSKRPYLKSLVLPCECSFLRVPDRQGGRRTRGLYYTDWLTPGSFSAGLPDARDRQICPPSEFAHAAIRRYVPQQGINPGERVQTRSSTYKGTPPTPYPHPLESHPSGTIFVLATLHCPSSAVCTRDTRRNGRTTGGQPFYLYLFTIDLAAIGKKPFIHRSPLRLI